MRKPGQDGDQRKDVVGDGYAYLSRVSVQRRAVCAMLQRSKVRWTLRWARIRTAIHFGLEIITGRAVGPADPPARDRMPGFLCVSRCPLRLFAVLFSPTRSMFLVLFSTVCFIPIFISEYVGSTADIPRNESHLLVDSANTASCTSLPARYSSTVKTNLCMGQHHTPFAHHLLRPISFRG